MEQRRTKRFSLQLPLAVTRTGTKSAIEPGMTRNISSCGVLFTSLREPDLGGMIEYVITLEQDASRRVDIRCIGKVVRCESPTPDEAPAHYRVAATLERYEFVRTA